MLAPGLPFLILFLEKEKEVPGDIDFFLIFNVNVIICSFKKTEKVL